MSVNEILAYLEVHYWVMIIIFLVSMLEISGDHHYRKQKRFLR